MSEQEAPNNIIPFKAAKTPEMEIAQPAYYPLVFTDNDKGMIVTVNQDGSIGYGPAFITNDETAKRFWETMGRHYAGAFRCSKCGAEPVVS